MVSKETSTDILIIGTGAAGLSASIEASSRGARVKIVEQAPAHGGTAIGSGGGVLMVDTPLQRKKGVEDSIELACEDWRKWSKGTADMEWARFYIERSLPELYHWTAGLGVEWSVLMDQEGNSVPRWHRPEGGGEEIVRCLYQEAVKSEAVEWAFSTRVKKLLKDEGEGGAVRGAEVQRESGEEEIEAKAVIAATGGFCSNHDMIRKHSPRLKHLRFLAGGGPGAFGSGHGLIGDAGGSLQHLEDIWMYAFATPDPKDRDGKRGLAIRGLKNAIWVNFQGKRFHNEDLSGGATGTPAVLSQKPPMCWAIIDSSMIGELVVSDPSYREGSETVSDMVMGLLEGSPDIKRAPSIEDLAKAMNVARGEFRKTMNGYNQYLEDGLTEDPAFGKDLRGMKKIERPPFYAIQFMPLARKNFGGVRTGLTCRVLDPRGEAVPGLYAAGELAGMAGGHINGAAGLEGTMLGPSIFSGRVAGAWAAHHLGFGQGFQ